MANGSSNDKAPPRAATSDVNKVTPLSDHAWITGRKRLASPAIRQLDQLLQRPETVAQLTPVALHRLTSELGLADSLPLLELAESDQIRGLIDLDVWRHDRVDGYELLDWLSTIAQLSQDQAAEHLRGLDVELVGFLLRSQLKIYMARNDEAPEEPEGSFYSTPDGWFVLDLLGESEGRNDQLVTVIETLYRDDQDGARRLLKNLMWEFTSDLEEFALRWRNARLEDLGFADASEALIVYAFLDPETVRPDEATADRPLRVDPEPLPTTELTAVLPADEGPGDPSESFWSRSVARINDDAERTRLGAALMKLGNLTMSADRVDPADTEHGQSSLTHLRGRLSLGLEQLCEGDVDRAPSVLHNVALTRVARLGHSLVLQRQRRLLPWLRTGRLGRPPRGIELLTSPLRDRLQSIMATRPNFMHADGLTRPFETREDLRAADALVDSAIAAAELVPKSSWPDPLPAETHLSSIFCTDVVNRVLARSGPLAREGVAAVMKQTEGGVLSPEISNAARDLAEQRLARPPRPHERDVFVGWLTDLAQTLGRMDPATFDLRFVDGLLTGAD